MRNLLSPVTSAATVSSVEMSESLHGPPSHVPASRRAQPWSLSVREQSVVVNESALCPVALTL